MINNLIRLFTGVPILIGIVWVVKNYHQLISDMVPVAGVAAFGWLVGGFFWSLVALATGWDLDAIVRHVQHVREKVVK